MLQLVNVGTSRSPTTRRSCRVGSWTRSAGWPPRSRARGSLHLSATAFGGGVAEINYTLSRSCATRGSTSSGGSSGPGRVLRRHEAIHNALQGRPDGLTEEQQRDLLRVQPHERRGVRGRLRLHHRPRPAAGGDDRLPQGLAQARWIWRCHIDLSTPYQPVVEVPAPSLRRYDAAIFHIPDFVPPIDGLRPRSSGRPRSTR